MNIQLKQFVIVPKKPKMSPGKIASQVAHATFLALQNENIDKLNDWKRNGMCVIVLQCKDTNSLLCIDKYLNQWNIKHALYIDEGLTEVDSFTPTALATGILTEDKFWVFETLKLYK